jgi:hypothetical protein
LRTLSRARLVFPFLSLWSFQGIKSEGLRDILRVVLHDIKDSCTEAGLSVTI